MANLTSGDWPASGGGFGNGRRSRKPRQRGQRRGSWPVHSQTRSIQLVAGCGGTAFARWPPWRKAVGGSGAGSGPTTRSAIRSWQCSGGWSGIRFGAMALLSGEDVSFLGALVSGSESEPVGAPLRQRSSSSARTPGRRSVRKRRFPHSSTSFLAEAFATSRATGKVRSLPFVPAARSRRRGLFLPSRLSANGSDPVFLHRKRIASRDAPDLGCSRPGCSRKKDSSRTAGIPHLRAPLSRRKRTHPGL